MNFKPNSNAEISGTSFITEVTLSYDALRRALGLPNDGDGFKVTTEWIVQGDDGSVWTVYDWKATNAYDGDLPDVETFLTEMQPYGWHIGGRHNKPVEPFLDWLKAEVEKAKLEIKVERAFTPGAF